LLLPSAFRSEVRTAIPRLNERITSGEALVTQYCAPLLRLKIGPTAKRG
jgi:hypothetical protein